MRFSEPLVPGRLIRRYKRFLADVRFEDGRVEVVHCANPGSMKTCVEPDAPVWMSHSKDPRRKLAHSLELIEIQGELVFINPVRVNRVVEEALRGKTVSELRGYDRVDCEVPFGPPASEKERRSRADFRLSGGGREDCIVEVKSVTLSLGSGRTAFPDSVSARGARHLAELVEVHKRGQRAVLLYCASRAEAKSVEAAREIDPVYAAAMDNARAAGVEILAYGCQVTPEGVTLARALPVL